MLVHEFVEGNKPNMVLVHGLLTPWQIWTPQISAFRERYNIYTVALNAHTEEAASVFISVQAEAEEIVQYFKTKNMDTIEVLCGLSLGGKIALEIWKSGKLKIGNLIMDGAPLVACPKFAINIMIKNYKKIICKSKARDKKVIESFKKNFLPEKYLDSYLKIADLMTDISIENILNSVFTSSKMEHVQNTGRILFLHGTKGNEVLSKKAADLMKKHYPVTEAICFQGDSHCYKAIYEPDKWIEVVEKFLRDSN